MEELIAAMEFFSSAEEARAACEQQPFGLGGQVMEGLFDFEMLEKAGKECGSKDTNHPLEPDQTETLNNMSSSALSHPNECLPASTPTRSAGSWTGYAQPTENTWKVRGKAIRMSEREAAYRVIVTSSVCKAKGLLYYYDCAVGHRRMTVDKLRALIFALMDSLSPEQATDDFATRVKKQILARFALIPDVSYDVAKIGLTNGVLSYADGAFCGQRFHQFPVTSKINARFLDIASAACPNFDRFLEEVSGGDPVLIQRMWQVIGYLLVPEQSAEVLVLFQGLSGTGKSVFADFLMDCFYPEDVTAADIFGLTKAARLKDLVGKALLVNAEMPDKEISPDVVKVLKQLTGGDMLHTRHPDFPKDSIEFRNSAKILLLTNYTFDVLHLDEALCRRIVAVPFRYKPETIDRNLKEKLAQERDAVVTKALYSYRQLVADDYRFAGDFCIDEVVENPLMPDSYVVRFLKTDCCAEEEKWTATSELYGRFCEVYGEGICSVKLFSTLLLAACRRMGYRVEKGRVHSGPKGNSLYGFGGIVLKSASQGEET